MVDRAALLNRRDESIEEVHGTTNAARLDQKVFESSRLPELKSEESSMATGDGVFEA